MEIDFTETTENIITALFKDIERATVDHKHPFRFCYLATTEVDNVPAQRTIILRSILPSKEMLIFTDYRTPKVQEIKQQPQVSLLFYHPRRKLQIRFKAIATIHHQDALCLQEWSKLSDHGKKDYQTTLPPGSDLPQKRLEEIHNTEIGSNFFSIISLQPISIDALQLSRSGHQRMIGQMENGEWTGSKVMP